MLKKKIILFFSIIFTANHLFSIQEAPPRPPESSKEVPIEQSKKPPVVSVVESHGGSRSVSIEPHKGNTSPIQSSKPEKSEQSAVVNLGPDSGSHVSEVPIEEIPEEINVLKKGFNNIEAMAPSIFAKAFALAPADATGQITFKRLTQLNKPQLDGIVSGIRSAFSTKVRETTSAVIDLLSKAFTAFRNALGTGANAIAARLDDFRSNLIALFDSTTFDELDNDSPDLLSKFAQGVRDIDIYAQQSPLQQQFAIALTELGFSPDDVVSEPDLLQGYNDREAALKLALARSSIPVIKRMYADKLDALRHDYNTVAQASGYNTI